ncbi:MAG: hypothetical protein MJZ64_08565, partial [Paludibacteraceae bacterium]|nr:hypothetical protein [Paludibacteraceae bacterium]
IFAFVNRIYRLNNNHFENKFAHIKKKLYLGQAACRCAAFPPMYGRTFINMSQLRAKRLKPLIDCFSVVYRE